MISHMPTGGPKILTHALNVRLAPGHAALIHHVAEEHDVGLSEALRLVLDEVIAYRAGEDPQESLWAVVASFEPDPGWVRRHGE
jgi:hypothetical protein